jgi:hypothetical protein
MQKKQQYIVKPAVFAASQICLDLLPLACDKLLPL